MWIPSKKCWLPLMSKKEDPHKIGVVSPSGFTVLEVSNPEANLPAATLQNFLNTFMENGGAKEVDYIHGTDSLVKLGEKQGNIGFYLPAMDKFSLFKSVILDGATPRKTFLPW